MIYQSFFRLSCFSRYTDSLSARFLTPYTTSSFLLSMQVMPTKPTDHCSSLSLSRSLSPSPPSLSLSHSLSHTHTLYLSACCGCPAAVAGKQETAAAPVACPVRGPAGEGQKGPHVPTRVPGEQRRNTCRCATCRTCAVMAAEVVC